MTLLRDLSDVWRMYSSTQTDFQNKSKQEEDNKTRDDDDGDDDINDDYNRR